MLHIDIHILSLLSPSLFALSALSIISGPVYYKNVGDTHTRSKIACENITYRIKKRDLAFSSEDRGSRSAVFVQPQNDL